MDQISELRNNVLGIMENPRLTHEQQAFNLAAAAQNSLPQVPGPCTD